MSSLLEVTSSNSSFSRQSPGLQLVIDSHSLGAYKTCPRWYYYTIVLGRQPAAESPHLTFGLLMHKAREDYQRQRSRGAQHEEALREALAGALRATWNKTLRRPWASDHPQKNRLTLIRTIVWYLDGIQDDPLQTIQLARGGPAVELHFQFDSLFRTGLGETWEFTGWLDRLATLNGLPYIDDFKTTGSTISTRWFEKFTPFNQFSMYSLAGQIVWKVPVQGLIVDGAQIAVTFSRFERQLIPRPPEVISEWHRGQESWLRRMEASAAKGAQLEEAGKDPAAGWEMNDTSCDKFGGCPARAICSRAPAARRQWLERDFRVRVWDPQQERGDI